MKDQESISTRIDRIVATFQAGRKAAEDNSELNKLLPILNSMDSEFRSMAFEGASMGIALRELETPSKHLTGWQAYLEDNPSYSTQIQIGLGWALADRNLVPQLFLESLDPIQQGRVLDGYGYFFGLFRRRLSIRSQQIPEGIPEQLLTAFDQGIGRSLWYISKGEASRLERMINAFPEERKLGIWRGIGVAATVVGGSTENELRSILDLAKVFTPQLKTGCAMGTASLVKSEVSNELTERVCRVWLGCLLEEVVDVSALMSKGGSYRKWVVDIELLFKKLQ